MTGAKLRAGVARVRSLGRHNLWNLASAVKFLAKWNLTYLLRDGRAAAATGGRLA